MKLMIGRPYNEWWKKRDIVIAIIILLTIIGWGGVINKYTSNSDSNTVYKLNYPEVSENEK